MDFCRLTKLYREGRGNFNIVSTVMFNMSQSYKDFKKYFNGVENWLLLLKEHLPSFYLRLYFDTTIHQNEQYIQQLYILHEKYPHLQLVYYNCPEFRENKEHKDLFGTLIRFLPLFQFPDNDTNYVLIRDLDVAKYDPKMNLYFAHHLKKALSRESGILMNLIGYEPEHIRKVNNKWGFNIMAPALSTNIKLPISILNNFIDKLHKSNRKMLKYGVDEIFLNDVLLDHYIPYKTNIAVITPSYSLYYIQNSLSKSLHYSKHDQESKEVMKCKTPEKLRQFMNDYKSIVKEKYRKQLDNYNPNNIITNYYI